jgi:hypothetical protein
MPLARDAFGRSIQALLPRTTGNHKITASGVSQGVGAFATAGTPAVQIARALSIQVVGGAIRYRVGIGAQTALNTDHYLDSASGRVTVSLQGDGGTEALQTHFACIAVTGTPDVYISELY